MVGIGFETSSGQNPLNLQEVIEKIDQLDSQYDFYNFLDKSGDRSFTEAPFSETFIYVNTEKYKKLNNLESDFQAFVEFSEKLQWDVALILEFFETEDSEYGDCFDQNHELQENFERIFSSTLVLKYMGHVFADYFACKDIVNIYKVDNSIDALVSHMKYVSPYSINGWACGDIEKAFISFRCITVVEFLQSSIDDLKGLVFEDETFGEEAKITEWSPRFCSEVEELLPQLEQIIQDVKNSPEYSEETT